MEQSILTNIQVGDIIWHTYYHYHAVVTQIHLDNKTIRIQPLDQDDNNFPFWLGIAWAKKVSQ